MKVERVDYSKKFIKDLRKAPISVRRATAVRIKLFLRDRNNLTLRNHALIGKYKGYRSINITGDWRAVFREYRNGRHVYFDTLGTHSQLYK